MSYVVVFIPGVSVLACGFFVINGDVNCSCSAHLQPWGRQHLNLSVYGCSGVGGGDGCNVGSSDCRGGCQKVMVAA